MQPSRTLAPERKPTRCGICHLTRPSAELLGFLDVSGHTILGWFHKLVRKNSRGQKPQMVIPRTARGHLGPTLFPSDQRRAYEQIDIAGRSGQRSGLRLSCPHDHDLRVSLERLQELVSKLEPDEILYLPGS